jgi:hypothetical protein
MSVVLFLSLFSPRFCDSIKKREETKGRKEGSEFIELQNEQNGKEKVKGKR